MVVAAGAGSVGGSAQIRKLRQVGSRRRRPSSACARPPSLPLQDHVARDGREAVAGTRSGGGSGAVVARRWRAMPAFFLFLSVCRACHSEAHNKDITVCRASSDQAHSKRGHLAVLRHLGLLPFVCHAPYA
jgi:hypothetical protein